MRHLLATYTFHIDAQLDDGMCRNLFQMAIPSETLFRMFLSVYLAR